MVGHISIYNYKYISGIIKYIFPEYQSMITDKCIYNYAKTYQSNVTDCYRSDK